MTTRPYLVLFDIDGTLTESMDADSELYVLSLETVFGFRDVGQDWAAYQHTTDSGVFREIFTARRQRAPTAEEVASFREHFVEAVATVAMQAPFREVPGARDFVARLAGMATHRVALATGGWSDSARCKLRSAGMSYDAFPSAPGDDAVSREEIIQTAIDRAIAHYGIQLPTNVVYVGDGVWDVQACCRVGISFIGIGSGSHVEVLRAAGARGVHSDFLDPSGLLDSISSAPSWDAGRHRSERRRTE